VLNGVGKDVDENADGATPIASSVAEPIAAPVLVTEQQVVFSTAAAVSIPRPKTTHRL
jgi:hypothetical protein